MKKKILILNEKGFALLTVLLLGFLSMGLIAVAFYMTSTSTELSGIEKRYSVELDAAKGVSEYVMAQILNLNLTCNSAAPGACTPDTTPDICNATAQIILNPNICTALGKAGCAGVSACYMSANTVGVDSFYSVRVTSTSNSGEQAIVDFVYKTN